MNEPIEAGGGMRLFCSFRTEGRLYGIDAAQIREVSAQVVFTPVPQAPPAVRGSRICAAGSTWSSTCGPSSVFLQWSAPPTAASSS